MLSSARRVLLPAPKADLWDHCLPEHQKRGGTRAAHLCSYLDQLDPHTVLLTEWRDNVSGACTPPKEMAFGSTTLSAMAHSSQRVPQSALAITARVQPV